MARLIKIGNEPYLQFISACGRHPDSAFPGFVVSSNPENTEFHAELDFCKYPIVSDLVPFPVHSVPVIEALKEATQHFSNQEMTSIEIWRSFPMFTPVLAFLLTGTPCTFLTSRYQGVTEAFEAMFQRHLDTVMLIAEKIQAKLAQQKQAEQVIQETVDEVAISIGSPESCDVESAPSSSGAACSDGTTQETLPSPPKEEEKEEEKKEPQLDLKAILNIKYRHAMSRAKMRMAKRHLRRFQVKHWRPVQTSVDVAHFYNFIMDLAMSHDGFNSGFTVTTQESEDLLREADKNYENDMQAMGEFGRMLAVDFPDGVFPEERVKDFIVRLLRCKERWILTAANVPKEAQDVFMIDPELPHPELSDTALVSEELAALVAEQNERLVALRAAEQHKTE